MLASAGEMALGVYRSQANDQGRHLMLNPPRKQYLDIQPGDKLVVLCLSA